MFRNIISRSRWMSDYWLLNQFASEYLTHFCFWIGLTFMISESVRRRLWLVFPLHDLATMCEASLPSTNLLRQGAVPVLYTMNTVVGLLLHPPAACCLLKYNSSNGSLQTLSDRMTTTLGSCSRFFARWTIEYTVIIKPSWICGDKKSRCMSPAVKYILSASWECHSSKISQPVSNNNSNVWLFVWRRVFNLMASNSSFVFVGTRQDSSTVSSFLHRIFAFDKPSWHCYLSSSHCLSVFSDPSRKLQSDLLTYK